MKTKTCKTCDYLDKNTELIPGNWVKCNWMEGKKFPFWLTKSQGSPGNGLVQWQEDYGCECHK